MSDWSEKKLEGTTIRAIKDVKLAPDAANGSHIKTAGLFPSRQDSLRF